MEEHQAQMATMFKQQQKRAQSHERGTSLGSPGLGVNR